MMKAIRKAKRELFKDLLYEEKLKQIKEGTYKGPVKVWNKKDKAGTATDSQQSPGLTECVLESTEANAKKHTGKGINLVKEQQPHKCPDSIEGLDLNYEFSSIFDDKSENIKTNNGNCSGDDAEEMEFNGIPYKIIETNVDDLDERNLQSEAESETELKDNTSTTHNEVEKSNQSEQDNSTVPANTKLVFEENRLMTCVEGFWIRRCCLLEVDELRAAKKKEIIAARDNGSDSPCLSKSEDKQFQVSLERRAGKGFVY